MFDGIISFFKGVIRKMFRPDDLKRHIGQKLAISKEMLDSIDLWNTMYCGSPPWETEYVKSLKIEQGICREFANVSLNEMKYTCENDKMQKIIDTALRDLNENLQVGLAMGSFCIKPLGGETVEYVPANRFIPLEYDARGRLLGVVFIQVKQHTESIWYIRLETHRFKNGTLTIENRAFRSSSASEIGTEISLSEVEEWASLPQTVSYFGLKGPDFGYYRNPIPNTVDGSKCGVSIFNSAISLIKDADEQHARLNWEFESGERAVHVDVTALQQQTSVLSGGKKCVKLPRLNKRLYRGLNLQPKGDEELFKEYSPAFREESILNGMEEYKRQIEFNVSLSYGDLSKPSSVEKTAEECKIAKKRKYNMVTAIQENLKECLEDLVDAIAFYNACYNTQHAIIISFKDSILTDEDTERQNDRSDVAMGVMSLLEYRMKWYNETKEQAEKMLPEPEELDGDG